MAGEQPERATQARLDYVIKEPRRPEAAAQRREPSLPQQMRGPVGLGIVRIPRTGAHARAGNRLENAIVGGIAGRVEHRHAPVDDVEGQMFGPADFRPNNLFQN